MNITLLSQMVKELLLDNDMVALPGLGSFVAELVPSTFSDRGFTINPPYRKLYFRENVEQDTLLVDLYSKTNNVSVEVADGVLGEFVGEMKEFLDEHKNIVFPELGRLRATKENNYFFVPFEEMDIYPEGIGLEPISLKAHYDQEEEAVAAVDVAEEIAAADEEEPAPEETTTEPIIELTPVEETPAETKKKGMSRGLKITLITLVVIVAVAIVLLGIFVLLANVAPDFIDSILYNEADREILKYM